MAVTLRIEEIERKFKVLLAKKSRTAKLWLQYIEYIENLKRFILGEDDIIRNEQVLDDKGVVVLLILGGQSRPKKKKSGELIRALTERPPFILALLGALAV